MAKRAFWKLDFTPGRAFGKRLDECLRAGFEQAAQVWVINFLKHPKDKDLAISALVKSEKGFRDEEWRRYLSNLPVAQAIGRFPYTKDRAQQMPFIFRPLQLAAPEPTDAQIEAVLGRIVV